MDLPELLETLGRDESSQPIGDELLALQSIFGEEALSLHSPWERGSNLRLELIVTLPSTSSDNDEIPFRLFISLPPAYPETSPPQLQLASKYIGPVRLTFPFRSAMWSNPRPD
jgi:hypothetical protein